MQSQYKYNIKNNNNIKLLLVYIKKTENLIKDEIFAIDKIILSTKVTIGKKKLNINIKKV